MIFHLFHFCDKVCKIQTKSFRSLETLEKTNNNPSFSTNIYLNLSTILTVVNGGRQLLDSKYDFVMSQEK